MITSYKSCICYFHVIFSFLIQRSEGSTSSGLRSSDLHQVKVAMTQQNVGKKTLPILSANNTSNVTNTTAANRSSLPNQPTKSVNKTDEKASKTKSWPYKLAEVRYFFIQL